MIRSWKVFFHYTLSNKRKENISLSSAVKRNKVISVPDITLVPHVFQVFLLQHYQIAGKPSIELGSTKHLPEKRGVAKEKVLEIW